jgi:hypothetical protein
VDLKKTAYSTGVTIKDRTAANANPNRIHTAIAPKKGSVSSGIIRVWQGFREVGTCVYPLAPRRR